eukprot:jgi/Chlat1/5345/Chrsp35S05271
MSLHAVFSAGRTGRPLPPCAANKVKPHVCKTSAFNEYHAQCQGLWWTRRIFQNNCTQQSCLHGSQFRPTMLQYEISIAHINMLGHDMQAPPPPANTTALRLSCVPRGVTGSHAVNTPAASHTTTHHTTSQASS